MNAIEIRDLTKRYGNLTAVNSLSLNIKQGEFFAMLGSKQCLVQMVQEKQQLLKC